ncbi:hypothetical protein TREMEDRAFT_31815, partial [Tremella mesenterica DSM 1558]|uniref:uncharacterized protein n=1 Tax=Tremella mesenterica (strain ATCC 24925 / CBS 8224 / DSM 1558 / NBRC 9311 / NRRL Y-6157 / RJB 2259-6 / UBC 559-6) TaxID=578456 RepID=UPI0003F48DD4
MSSSFDTRRRPSRLLYVLLCFHTWFEGIYSHTIPSRNVAASFPLTSGDLQPRATQAPGFVWGKEPMRGVNIGGWLVLEPWITPSIFAHKPSWVVDEWTYGQYMLTQNNTYGEIQTHWNTWFQLSELEDIARVGLNTIRIQIGFWSVIPLQNGEPYLIGAYDYLKKAVQWASTLNLKVMIDLHGAPGSQNGFDNSGLRGTRQWFANTTNLDRTLTALQVLTHEFTQEKYNNTVLAIELINEPFPYTNDEVQFLQSFYTQAYQAVRTAQQANTVVVALDDGYQGLYAWTGFMVEPDYHDVAMDTVAMNYYDNLNWTCSQQQYLMDSNDDHWTIVGEFTRARYDNTLNGSMPLTFPGDCSTKTGSDPSKWDNDYVDHLARSFEAQTWVYEKAVSQIWVAWTWKTEQAADWSMQTGITYG